MMDLEEALDEVLAAARLPKQQPTGATPTELIGEAAMEAAESGRYKARA